MHTESTRDERVPGQPERDDDARRDRETQRPSEETRHVARRVRHEREEEGGDADREAVRDGELSRQERELEEERAEDDREQGGVHRLVQEQHRDPLDVRDDLTPLGDDVRQMRELPVEKYESGDGLRGRRPRVHRDADVRSLDREGVVDAVPGHGDGVSMTLQRRHHALLLLGGHAPEDGVPVEHVGELGVVIGKLPGVETLCDIETDFTGDGRHRAGVVAGDDADADLLATEIGEGLRCIGAHLLAEGEHDDRLERVRQPFGIDIGVGEGRFRVPEDQGAATGLGECGDGAPEFRVR